MTFRFFTCGEVGGCRSREGIKNFVSCSSLSMVSCLGPPVCVFIGRAGQTYCNATCSPDPSIDADRWRTSAQDRALRASPPPSGNPRPPTRPSDAHQPAPTASLQPGTRVDRNRHPGSIFSASDAARLGHAGGWRRDSLGQKHPATGSPHPRILGSRDAAVYYRS